MKQFVLFTMFIVYWACASGQNLIGLKESEIRKYMRENRKEMNMEKVTNTRFNYLKYSDNSDSQTTLFFIGADSLCNSIRIICDETAKIRNIKDFNAKYTKTGDNRWTDNRKGKSYRILLKDETWSSIITIEPTK